MPGKAVAGLMGHANVSTTLNMYTQVCDDSLRTAAAKVDEELFVIVHKPHGASALALVPQAGLEPNPPVNSRKERG